MYQCVMNVGTIFPMPVRKVSNLESFCFTHFESEEETKHTLNKLLYV